MNQVILRLGITGSIVLGCLITASSIQAQIVPDNTLPANSRVTPGCTVCTIEDGTVRGVNLFHSFREFSVPTGGEAFFNNAPQIQNILTRVTGNSVSNIDGLIRANGSANLFFLNPNGIIFGAGAKLNIGGSFLASTASSFKFPDGSEFSATNPEALPLLTVSVPLGLQFGGMPKQILVQGSSLAVPPQKTLALLGGDVAIAGGEMTAPAGRIELGSITGKDEVSVTPTLTGIALGYGGVSSFGDIQLSQAASVDASGVGGGDIQVQSRRLTLTDGSRLASFTLGSEPGGTIAVNASESVELTGTGTYVQDTQRLATGKFEPDNLRSGFFSVSYGTGAAGNIRINTSSFIARNGAFVVTSTLGKGQGGEVTLTSDVVELSASGLIASPAPGSTGDFGNLTINTGRLIARDNTLVTTTSFGEGRGGNLTVTASDFVELIGSNPFPIQQGALIGTGIITSTVGAGAAGDLLVDTGRLILRDGGRLGANTFRGGQGGNITVTALDSVELSGTSPDGRLPSRISAFAQPNSTGQGGSLTITTGNLIIQDEATVNVNSLGTGDAGNLQVEANFILLDNKATLTAETVSGNGGDVRLQVSDLLLIRHNSRVSTTAGSDQLGGDGGNISIRAPFVAAVRREDSDIRANAFTGKGGRVDITASGIFGLQFQLQNTPESDITASSTYGVSGEVTLNAPDVDHSHGLAQLPEQLVDPSRQIAQGCAARGENLSKFSITGRGGLPQNPTEVLSPDVVQDDFGTLATREKDAGTQGQGDAENSPTTHSASDSQSSIPNPPTQLVEAQGWIISRNGKVILTAQALEATPHGAWQTPANCQVSQTASQP